LKNFSLQEKFIEILSYIYRYTGVHVKCALFLSDFNKIEFSRRIFERLLKYQIARNPSNRSRIVPYGDTKRQDKANSRFSQFCERT